MKTQELPGYWWLPEKPDERLAGTLNLVPGEGVSLSLMGFFGPRLAIQGLEGMPRHQIILGTTKGKDVTLFDVNSRGFSFSFPGFDSWDFHAQVAYIGGHFHLRSQEEDEFCFDSASVVIEHLLEWMATPPFYQRKPQNEFGKKSLEIGYQLSESVKAEIPNGSVLLNQVVDSSQSLEDAHLHRWARISFDARVPWTFNDWVLLFIQPMQNLLSLGVGTAARATRFTVRAPETPPPVGDSSSRRREVEVYYRGLKDDATITKERNRDAMLFTLADMGDRFQTMIAAWFELSGAIEGILNLYFSVRRNPDTYLEHQFLSIVQALEGYHGYRFGNEALPADEYQRTRQEILDSVLEQHRPRIKGLLNNQPSLRMRLEGLIESTGGILEPWVSTYGGTNKLVGAIVKIRGTLAHPSHRQNATQIDGHKLHELTEVLSFLFEACLLHEMGFESEQIVQLFQRNKRYQFASSRAAS